MATIQARKTGDGSTRYRVLVRLKGFPVQTATFRRKTEAKQWAQDTESAIREGRYFKTSQARKHTVAEVVERYKEQILEDKPAARRRDQGRHLDWWAQQIGAYTLADVTPPLVAERRDRLARGRTVRGEPRTPATVNRYLTTLSHAFTVASRDWGWLEHNPLRKVQKLREPRGRVRCLSTEERQQLLDACRAGDDPRLYPLVVLALSTGARQGELLRLRWPDIDFTRRRAVAHQTKNRERRALPIEGQAFKLLREMSRVRRFDTDLVFAGRDGRAIFPRWAWDRALRAAQIDDLRFHDLRHSAASYLAMSGATLAEIAEVLGHKTLAMVKRYSHLTDQHTSKVVARMNQQIFGNPPG